ncbi:hypothetical protein PCC7418_2073 [Halothece sp. PCC 7418]|uniref:DUF7305 domain-containing protein n=1 Tax=Halothece sp. (strain PCC 7418) TaxID=65093 RepID=UPI0002A08791|nr:hypothetical protein [Halothece sp. PCC 7418]AFZ44236.1 hypothetical protein PCC7418_2073 [Halothece sp. PCC 7418]
MNAKPSHFYVKLFQQYFLSQRQNQGFALPLIVGLGLVMTVIGMTLIGQSQKDQVKSTLKEGSAESLSIAEAGITDALSLINAVPTISTRNLDQWSEIDTDDSTSGIQLASDSCSGGGSGAGSSLSSRLEKYAQANLEDRWVAVNNGEDQYRINRYTYDDGTGTGTLQIEGQANLNKNASTTILEVSIPVDIVDDSFLTGGLAPGLLVKQGQIDNETIDGDVLYVGCNDDTNNFDEKRAQITGQLKFNPALKFPEIPADDELPATPKNLGDITSSGFSEIASSSNEDKSYLVAFNPFGTMSDLNPPLMATKPDSVGGDKDKDEDTGNENTDGSGGSANCDKKKNVVTLPLPSDDTTSSNYDPKEQRYYYKASSLNLDSNTNLKIKNGENVVIVLDGGDIDIAGNTCINGDNKGTPTALTIYGRGTNNVCLSGTTRIFGFIFAPDASFGVNGGGSGSPIMEGALWANNWGEASCAKSKSKKVYLSQAADWNKIPQNIRNQIDGLQAIDPINAWERQAK